MRGGTMQMFSTSSLFSAYAALTALLTLIQQFYHQFIPSQVRQYICQKMEQWFTKPSSSSITTFTLVIDQYDEVEYDALNQVFHACEAYLASKLKSTSTRLKATRQSNKDQVSFKLAQAEKYNEVYEGIQFHWKFIYNNNNVANNNNQSQLDDNRSPCKPRFGTMNNLCFELSLDIQHKDKLFDSYMPYILKFYDEISERKKELKLHTLECVGGKVGGWRAVKFKHPFTFDALALEPEVKKAIIHDLDRFLKRREFYKKVGRAWKRGYLLYGPPGTGKSSLIAAIANYLKFDVYDLQLSSVVHDSTLRKLLLLTTNKSILVIEDIDCCSASAQRQALVANEAKEKHGNEVDRGSKISLSGFLNFIDGLWSSCGDERIFIFTTNHKEKLDPALLRPGRMDMHIHMSYLTMPAFRTLALNYLNVSKDHPLFKEIEQLIQATNVSPAQVAEELIRSDDPDIALSSLVDMLKQHTLGHSQHLEIKFPMWLKNGIVGNGLDNFINGLDHIVSDQFSSD